MNARLGLWSVVALAACGGDGTGPAGAAKLAFRVVPSSVATAAVIAPAVEVEVRDAGGNTVTTATTSVTLTLNTGVPTGVLTGSLTIPAAAGVAVFSDLKIGMPGRYTLIASAPGLAADTSSEFTVGGPPPLAGLRYINLVSDTGAVDFRILNFTSYAPNATGATFRTGGAPYGIQTNALPPYFPVLAGTDAHIRVSPTSTDPVVAARILFDTTLSFAPGVNYTFILIGLARSSAIHARVASDSGATSSGVAYRVVHLGGGGALDLDIVAQSATAPLAGTATFGGVAAGAITGYVNLAADPALQAVATAPGSRAPFLFFAALPGGVAGTPTSNPLPGSGVAGSGFTALIAPRPVAGSLAQSGCGTPAGCLASDSLPRFLFLVDRYPPLTAP